MLKNGYIRTKVDYWHTEKALGVLATLATGKLCIKTRISKDDEAQIANSQLLEPKRCIPSTDSLTH